MHERYDLGEQRPDWMLEEEADSLLANGDILAAAGVLGESVRADYDPRTFSHVDFKAFTLPLYDLAYYPSTEERVRAANDTYGLIAGLIDRELDAYNNFSETAKEKYKHLGRLSELTVFSLLIREGVESNVAAVPLPAPRQEDMHGGIDFYLSPVGTGRVNDGWPIQVKTFLRDDTREESDPDAIALICMEELDPYVRTPNDQASLLQCILQELDGTSNDENQQKLAEATAKLYEKVTNSEKMHRSAGRHRRMAKLARMLFRTPTTQQDMTEVG